MNVRVVYASNSGNTKLAAERIGERLSHARHTVTVSDVIATSPPDLADADMVVLGSNTWLTEGKQGQLPSQALAFGERVRRAGPLPGKPFAVFGFGRHEFTYFCAAAAALEKLVEDIGGKLIVPTLRIDGFVQWNQERLDEWSDLLADAIKKEVTPAKQMGKRIKIG